LAKINLGGDTSIVVANAVAPTEDNKKEKRGKRKEEREKRKGERGAIAPAVLATNQQPVTRMLRPTLQRAFALAKINLGGDTNIVVANAKAPTQDNHTGDNNFVGAKHSRREFSQPINNLLRQGFRIGQDKFGWGYKHCRGQCCRPYRG